MIPELIGLDYKSASPEIRKQFYLSSSKIKEIYETLVEPVVILSTCNRTEFYFLSNNEFETAEEKLSKIFGSRGIPHCCFYKKQGQEVVNHLLEVAVGLHSMLLGENEILGQIETTYQIASEIFPDGYDLTIFREAIKTARRIRERTKIGTHSVSLTSLTVKEICRSYPAMHGFKVLVLGQGTIATKLARALKYQGFNVTLLTRRIPETPIQDVDYCQWNRLASSLQEHPIIIAATTAPHTLIREEHAPWVKDKLLIDLAFPYNIDRKLTQTEDCVIRDLDYFRQCSEVNLTKKRNSAQAALSLCRIATIRICDKLKIGEGISRHGCHEQQSRLRSFGDAQS